MVVASKVVAAWVRLYCFNVVLSIMLVFGVVAMYVFMYVVLHVLLRLSEIF